MAEETYAARHGSVQVNSDGGDGPPLLQLDNVSMIFGGLRAVDRLTLEVCTGKIHALIGPNGAGKTTVLNIISGFYKPTEGLVRFNGQTIQGFDSAKIAGMGMARTFQNVRLFKELTALENVQIGMHRIIKEGLAETVFRTPAFRRAELRSAEKAKELLAEIGLQDKATVKARNLSYGQQKLIEIARALAQDPKQILLDEPAAGLNETETTDLVHLVRIVRDRGITILLIEHNMNFVMSLADRITVLNFGRKIADGAPGEIVSNEEVIQAYLGRRPSLRST
ncbi:MAG: ABC transporter ATP-binding protein [Candidatus Korobacteraceae bacterium]|jgi:ABC-type branched-subunit amino acid transport system ATPase component